MQDEARSIRQTREPTEAEREAMCRLWRALALPEADCRFCARLRQLFDIGLWLSMMVAAGVIDRLRHSDPALALLAAVAGFGVPLLVFLGRERTKRVTRDWRARDVCTGDVYTIDAEGLQRRQGNVAFACPWSSIAAITQDADYLVAHIAPTYSLQLAKGAFAGQDAAGFCAELERRWREQSLRTQRE